MASFWGELRRRNVFRVGIAYLAAVWVLIQVADVVSPNIGAPAWITQALIYSSALGFPLALILAWFYEITPEGVKVTADVQAVEAVRFTGRKIDFAIIGLLVLALGFVLVRTPEEPRQVLPNSVAVLPFENHSPDADDAYFATGLHDEVLSQLAKLDSLNVISRTSVLRYANSDLSVPEIARELNVETVMEGSVRYANGQVRITTQLIDAMTGGLLWADTYDREFADVFAIESDIAMNVANALEAEFLPEEREDIERALSNFPAAHALYLRARGYRGLDTIPRTLSALTDALDIDPQFASAYAYRAWTYALGLLFSAEVPVEEYKRNVVADAERALELDRSLGLAHTALAVIHAVNRDWAEARDHTGLAYELSPNDPSVVLQYIRLLRNTGEYAASIRAHERWVELEPNVWLVHEQLGITYRYDRNYDASALAARRAVELDPARPGSHVHLAVAEALRSNADEAVSELQIAEQLFRGDFDQVFRVAQMATAYRIAGERQDAERLYNELEELDRENTVGEAVWALAHIALEEYDQAYQRLQIAMENPSPRDSVTLLEIKANPWGFPELEAPRFREILSELWSVE